MKWKHRVSGYIHVHARIMVFGFARQFGVIVLIAVASVIFAVVLAQEFTKRCGRIFLAMGLIMSHECWKFSKLFQPLWRQRQQQIKSKHKSTQVNSHFLSSKMLRAQDNFNAEQRLHKSQ